MEIETILKKLLKIFRFLAFFTIVGASAEIVYATYIFLTKTPDAPWWVFTEFYTWLLLGLYFMIWYVAVVTIFSYIPYLEEKAIEDQNKMKKKKEAGQ